MKPFEYAAPNTLEEAIGLLGEKWGEAEVLAGGTDLVTALKQGIMEPDRLVSLKNLTSLQQVELREGTLHIGAMAPLAAVSENSTAQEHFPSLVQAIEGIGSRQIIVHGTVGGDLCQRPRCWYFRSGYGLFGQHDGESLVLNGDNRFHAIFGNEGPAYFVHPSSLGPALIALDATLIAVGPKGKERTIGAGDFFKTPQNEDERETVLRPDEVVTEIRVPLHGLKNATYEVRHRQGFDWPYVTATVAFQERGGTASDGRVVLGHVAPVPWHSEKASQSLNGQALNEPTAKECGQAAIVGAKPLSGNRYKVQLTKTAVKRAVLSAAGIEQEA